MAQNKPNIEAIISDCYCGKPGTIQYFVGDASRGEGPVYDIRFCSGLHRQIWSIDISEYKYLSYQTT